MPPSTLRRASSKRACGRTWRVSPVDRVTAAHSGVIGASVGARQGCDTEQTSSMKSMELCQIRSTRRCGGTLDESWGFTGKVANFRGQDFIDLADITFGAQTTLGYATAPAAH